MTTIGPALASALDRFGPRPAVTYLDQRTGERTELSGTTLRNWADKTANFLRDGCDVQPGDTVAVVLEPHWHTAAFLLGTWFVGGTVTDRAAPDSDLAVLVTDEQRFTEHSDGNGDEFEAGEIVVTSLDPMGRPAPVGSVALDYTTEVRTYGDHCDPVTVGPDSPALHAGSWTLSHGALPDTAAAIAQRLGLRDSDRVLVSAAAVADAGPVAWLLAPMLTGSPIVLVRLYDDPGTAGWVARTAAQEQVTAGLGVHPDATGEHTAAFRSLT